MLLGKIDPRQWLPGLKTSFQLDRRIAINDRTADCLASSSAASATVARDDLRDFLSHEQFLQEICAEHSVAYRIGVS
jgi:hypothetical protein